MKTEKRLTMALSVLVALMMLAVPLASSSNLFVDGGQTNSNGDAPLLGADAPSESYTITLLLNGNENSLDKATYTALGNPGNWYLNDDGNLYTVVKKDTLLSTVFADLYTNTYSNIKKTGYDLDSWKDEATGAVYGSDAANDNETKITSNMTFSAQWLLNDGYCEIPVIVDYKGEQKEYVKAYPYLAGSDDKKITIADDDSLIKNGVSDLDTYGIVVNAITKEAEAGQPATIGALSKPVYSFKATYGDNKEFEFTNNSATISADSKITITYTFDKDNYSEIVVSSIAFKDGKDITLYADRNRIYTYPQVYTALTTDVDDGKDAHLIKAAITIDNTEDKVITTEGYELTGWNEGAEPLSSEKEASSPLTLDAKLNGYYVIFMSKGQSEYVYIPFGELSADKTTLDIAGVNHWVWMKYTDYNAGTFTATGDKKTINSFNFASTQNINDVEKLADGKTPAAVLIACFTPTGSTAYAVFDANDNNPATSDANFGNELVKKIVIPGKDGDPIAKPSLIPELEGKNLFLGWVDDAGNAFGSETYNKATVQKFYADWESYKSSITFNGDKSVNGVIYFNLDTIPTDVENLFGAFVALSYNDKLYSSNNLLDSSQIQAFINAIKNILSSSKDGHYIDEWKDADGKTVIKNVDKLEKLLSTTLPTNEGEFMSWLAEVMSLLQDSINFEDLKGDVNFYANFVPEDYLIVYYANTATASNIMVQVGTVDEMLALFGESTFGNEGYVLKEWNTRPDGKGTSYALGSDFTLSGSEYEDALDVPDVAGIPVGYDKCVILYAIWEKVGGSGNEPGNNSEGNNTDTYLLAGILAVIIILIILIAFLMRRKQ